MPPDRTYLFTVNIRTLITLGLRLIYHQKWLKHPILPSMVFLMR